MRRSVAVVLVIVFVSGFIGNSVGQDFSKRKFILGVSENLVLRKGKHPKHDHLSFTFAFVNKKGNHNELSISKLRPAKNRFGLGLGFQYKWQWLKSTGLPVNPYLGFYNNADFESRNLLNEEETSDYTITLRSGIAPGINASIGRFFLDCNLSLEIFKTSYSKEENIDLSTLKKIKVESFNFKDYLGLRLGGGFRF